MFGNIFGTDPFDLITKMLNCAQYRQQLNMQPEAVLQEMMVREAMQKNLSKDDFKGTQWEGEVVKEEVKLLEKK